MPRSSGSADAEEMVTALQYVDEFVALSDAYPKDVANP